MTDDKPKLENAEAHTFAEGAGSLTISNLAATSLTFSAFTTTCAKITAEGEVSIDWQACERAVEEEKSNPMGVAIARLMLAIRDGTWKAMT